MVEIVKSMGWTYVSIIYEESNYGIKVSAQHTISVQLVSTSIVFKSFSQKL